jgi:hypothetical protein
MATVSQSGLFTLQALTSLGALGVGMRLYFYEQGTTTKKDVYIDAAGATPHTLTSDGAGGEYVALDARGELPAPIYMTAGAYDVCLKTAAGATVWTRRADPVGADLAGSGGSASIGFLQAGTGAVARTAQAKMRDVVSVKDFGATGDGVTDDTTAIQAAFTYAASFSATLDPTALPVVVFFPKGEYLTSSELTSNTPISIKSDSSAEILCSGTAGIRIGSNVAETLYSMDIELPNIRRVTPAFDSGSFGFRLINARNSLVRTRDIVGFEKGFSAVGDGNSFAYNDIFIGRLANNKYNLHFSEIDTASTGTLGWINENTWYGGKYEHRSGTPSLSGGAWNIYMPSRGGIANNGPNRNVFVRPCAEGLSPDVIKLECGGDENLFISPRFEDGGLTPAAVVFTSTSRANVIQFCELSSRDPVFSDLGTGNSIISFRNDITGNSWDTNSAVQLASNIRGNDRCAVGAKALGTSSDCAVGFCGDGTILWPGLFKRMSWSGDNLGLSSASNYAATGYVFTARTSASAPNLSLFVDSADGAIKFKNAAGVVTAL